MRILFAYILALFPLAAASASDFVVAAQGGVPVARRMEMCADYVGVNVIISSVGKNAAKRTDDIRKTQESLLAAVRKHGGLEVRTQWVQRYGAVSDTSFSLSAPFGASGSYSGNYRLEYRPEILVLGKMAPSAKRKELEDEIAALIASFKPEGDATVSTGAPSLVIDNPEQYRPRLVALIGEDVVQLRRSLGGTGEAEIGGLESPVVVVQASDSDVVLYIPYRLKLVRK